MAYTTIKKASDYFNTVLYTGNGSTQSITGVGFQPDLTWLKRRSADGYHFWTDAVRGVTKTIYSNVTDAEVTKSNGLTAFGTDGFTVGSDADINGNGQTHVGWSWLASNTTASNTDGSITSTVSANTTSGFSIVSYTGTGSAGTIGHGLSSVPKIIIVKNRSSTTDWYVYTEMTNNTHSMLLNSTSAKVGPYSDNWNNTSPTSSVFSVGSSSSTGGASGNNMIAYCFAEKKGFSKFGSYTGNGSTDGSFCYLGMKPKFIMIKRTDSTGDWVIYDGVKEPYNVIDTYLEANSSNADVTLAVRELDILSNGFKVRGTNVSINASGSPYIYMAFAEEPLVGDNPATAR